MPATAKTILLACAAAVLLSGERQPPRVVSEVVICNWDGTSERLVYSSAALIEAPNWSRDGRELIWNSGGSLWRFSLTRAAEPTRIATGDISRVTLDHGISPDGRRIAISSGELYTVPYEGGNPFRVTLLWPSYFHSWSPDGRTLLYGARRHNNFDIYSIPAAGGGEKRLTASLAYDGNPDCSPDGKFIYFNSDRAGSQAIWRIPISGAGADDRDAARITYNESEDWFPHPSPDGKYLLFLSFQKGVFGHPRNQGVELRQLLLQDRKLTVRTVKTLLGGQGTINANSWAPDSQRFAYVRYSGSGK